MPARRFGPKPSTSSSRPSCAAASRSSSVSIPRSWCSRSANRRPMPGTEARSFVGIAFATQPIEHGQAAALEQVANGARNALADSGQCLQTFQTLLLEDVGHRTGQPP